MQISKPYEWMTKEELSEAAEEAAIAFCNFTNDPASEHLPTEIWILRFDQMSDKVNKIAGIFERKFGKLPNSKEQ